MKKFLITLVACFFVLISFSQNVVPECPPGTHPVFVNNCGAFRFHRPINNCESGFWFCSVGGCSGWHIECWANTPNLQGSNPVATITKGQASIWGQIVNNKFEIHFPIELTTTQGYTAQDLQVFSVDTDDQFFTNGTVQYTMKMGQYPVNTIGNELVVLVDLK